MLSTCIISISSEQPSPLILSVLSKQIIAALTILKGDRARVSNLECVCSVRRACDWKPASVEAKVGNVEANIPYCTVARDTVSTFLPILCCVLSIVRHILSRVLKQPLSSAIHSLSHYLPPFAPVFPVPTSAARQVNYCQKEQEWSFAQVQKLDDNKDNEQRDLTAIVPSYSQYIRGG